MALPTVLTMRQWEQKTILASILTQSGKRLDENFGGIVEWSIVGGEGFAKIDPIGFGLKANLVAIGSGGSKLVSIQEDAYAVDLALPGSKLNKVTKLWPMTITILADPLQTPDANFAAE